MYGGSLGGKANRHGTTGRFVRERVGNQRRLKGKPAETRIHTLHARAMDGVNFNVVQIVTYGAHRHRVPLLGLSFPSLPAALYVRRSGGCCASHQDKRIDGCSHRAAHAS